MEEQKELTILSELSLISIKNYSTKFEVNFLPHIKTLLSMASSHQPQTAISPEAKGAATIIEERSSIINLSQAVQEKNVSGRTLVLKEQPFEIVIEKDIDDDILLSLSRLAGEHSPQSMNTDELQSIAKLLEEDNSINILKYKRNGVRIIFRIPEDTFQPLHGLPPVFNQFTGRENELSELKVHQAQVQVISPLERFDQSFPLESVRSQIAGTAGVGKSRLANYYARQQFREKKYQWVIWLSGDTQVKVAENSLRSQFLTLGIKLGFVVKQIDEKELYTLIYKRLSQKGKGLIVFDDVPNYECISRYLPNHYGQSNMDVLITTRNARYFGPEVKKITLDVFTLEDAKRYILRTLEPIFEKVSEEDAELLATTLGRYPLALTQALAYIADKKCSIKNYCERFQKILKARKVYLNEPVNGNDPYEQERQDKDGQFKSTMVAVIQLSLEQVKDICDTSENYDQALRVLMASAYLAPEVRIPKALLGAWIPEDEGDIQIDQALTALRTLSLLEESNEYESYQMHQMIQEVLKLNETPEDVLSILLRWTEIIVKYLGERASLFTNFDMTKIKMLQAHTGLIAHQLCQQAQSDEILMAHSIMALITGSACRQQGKEKIGKSHFEDSLKSAQQLSTRDAFFEGYCLMNVGASMYACGDLRGAKRFLEEALPMLKGSSSEMNSPVAYCMMNLGLVIGECGDHQAGIRLLEAALLTLKDTLGEGHSDVAICLMNLGQAKLDYGDSRAGKALSETAISIFRTTLSKNHPYVGRCLAILGHATLNCGDPKSAKKLLAEAFPILTEAFGERHVTTSACVLVLGEVKLAFGDISGAKMLFEEALSSYKEFYGESHELVGRCLLNLGGAILAGGDYYGAKRFSEAALQILKATLGEKHMAVGHCLMNLGISIMESGDALGAKAELEAALSILKSAMGDRNAKVGACLMNLGLAKLECGETQDAKNTIEAGLSILKSNLGDRHPDVGKCLLNLGLAHKRCGDLQGAKALFEVALSIFAAAYGDRYVEVGRCLGNLGAVTLMFGDLNNAKKMLESALSILKATVGERHKDVGMCLSTLGAVTLGCGDPRGAREKLELAFPILKASLGERHGNVGTCLSTLGEAMVRCGDFQEAKRVLDEALQILKVAFGDKSKLVGVCLVNLGEALISCRDPEGAKGPLELALPILKAASGEKHPTVGFCLMHLGCATYLCDDPPAAKEMLELALPMLKTASGDNHAELGKCLLFLGMACLNCSELLNAKKYLEAAKDICVKFYPMNHPITNTCNDYLVKVAQAYDSLEQNHKNSSMTDEGEMDRIADEILDTFSDEEGQLSFRNK